MRMLASLSLAILLLAGPARAETCRLALVLALDVSGSVNDVEYREQLGGVAYALDSPPVRKAILADVGAPVALAVFEWSSQNHQFLIQPWITLDSHAAIDEASARIRGYQKRRAGLKTALSTALLYAAGLFQDKSHCWKKKIDVSGDGTNNIGPDVREIYRLPLFDRVTVNALVVGNPSSDDAQTRTVGLTKEDLQAYYEREVIRGPDAFSLIAHGYEDYGRAMQEKLLKEIEVPVLGSVLPTRH